MKQPESSQRWSARVVLCAMAMALVVTVATRSARCSGNDALVGLEEMPVRLRFRKSPQLHEVSRKLELIARKTIVDAKPFEFQIHLNPWYLPTMKDSPPFWMDGLFANPGEQTRYLTLEWGYGDRSHVYIATKMFRPPRARKIGMGSPFPPQPPPERESADEHPSLGGWKIDLPEIGRLIREHAYLFAAGVNFVEVTSVKRYRHDEALRSPGFFVSRFFLRKPDGARHTLEGVDDSRTIVELVETARARADEPCVQGSKGHYLIVDATSAVPLEHGIFLACSTVAIQSCKTDSDCPGFSRCLGAICGRTNMWCNADAECKYTEFCDLSQGRGPGLPGKCVPRGGHYPDE